jgi:hypothetical protein
MPLPRSKYAGRPAAPARVAAGIAGEAVTATIVNGLIERDAAGGLALTIAGRAILRMLVATL